MWRAVPADRILNFLSRYQMDESATQVRSEPMRDYIRRQTALGELTEWVVAVMGQAREDPTLGTMELGIEGAPVNAIRRTRIKGTSTLKAITSQDDQEVGLSREQITAAAALPGSAGPNLRAVRSPTEGLLLLYPISRLSGHGGASESAEEGRVRVPIFDDPTQGVDVVGLALLFPRSDSAASVEYVTGGVGADGQ